MASLSAERAERFRRAHELNSLDELDDGDIETVIESHFEVDSIIRLDRDKFVPTDNAARPKSILVGDATMEFTDGGTGAVMVEIQCVEEMKLPDAEHHDDGTITIPVGGEADMMYRYDSLDVRLDP